jgi:DNA invertase Pin-like site-specific DNA recombinase
MLQHGPVPATVIEAAGRERGFNLKMLKVDLVMAWSVDRLGRSLQDLVGFLSEIHSLGVDLYLHQQGIDTTTPAGKAMFQMMGVFADYADTAVMRRPTSDAEQAVVQSIDAA